MSENIFVNDPSILISVITFLKIVVFMIKKKEKKNFLNNRENRERILLFQILYECLCMWNVPCLNINLAFDPRGPFANHFRYPKPLLQNPVNNRNCVKHVLKVRITKF